MMKSQNRAATPPIDQQIRDLWTSLRTCVTHAPSLADAKPPVVKAIRYLEGELVRVLDGARLQGLPNLGSREVHLRGVRLRGTLDAPLPRLAHDEKNSPWTLILGETGHIEQVRAERVDRRDFELVVRPATDAAIVIEDLPGLAVALGVVLPRHQAMVRDKTLWLDALEGLATQASALRLGV